MAPLRHYSIANGLKMAKVSPEMRVIQERYRKVPLMDPKRQHMQEEMASLYARHGMNMGTQMTVGCLPMLLTMPFLIAFYRVLSVSIDLRGRALPLDPRPEPEGPAVPDPHPHGGLHVRHAEDDPHGHGPRPAADDDADAAHARGHARGRPAGLNLYWLASNLCSIVQQTVTMRLLRRKDASRRGSKEMSDRVFSGRDVAEALGMAAQALGLPPARFRYFVLDAGTAGGLGLKPTPARVAVLLAGTAGAAVPGGPSRAPAPREPAPPVLRRRRPPRARAPCRRFPRRSRRVVAALGRGGRGRDRRAREWSPEALQIELSGGDVASFLLGPEEPARGRGPRAPPASACSPIRSPRVDSGSSARVNGSTREARLRTKALELAAAVLARMARRARPTP